MEPNEVITENDMDFNMFEGMPQKMVVASSNKQLNLLFGYIIIN